MKNNVILTILAIWLMSILVACGQSVTTDEQLEEESIEEVQGSEPAVEKEEEIPDETEPPSEEETISSETSETIEGELTVHFINVGQANATLLEYSHEGENYRILIDTGDWNRNDVSNYLKAQNIAHIDILIGTHVHADHIGQIDKIINNFDVEEVWMTGHTSTSKIYQRVLAAIEANDIGYNEPRAGEEYDIGPLELAVLHPTSLASDANENSISMRMQYDEFSFVFTGDAEMQNEQAMISSGQALEADVLQLGHHGSKTSSTSEFLNAVNPQLAIYSAGQGNSYGHPHAEVINRVLDAGIELYGTDTHGTIIVKTNGKDYSVLTKKDGTITPPSTGSQTDENVENNEDTEEVVEQQPVAGCIDINSASVEELQEIIHFGPARAEDLIQGRPYSSIDDLSKINGIAAGRLSDIKSENKACVGG